MSRASSPSAPSGPRLGHRRPVRAVTALRARGHCVLVSCGGLCGGLRGRLRCSVGSVSHTHATARASRRCCLLPRQQRRQPQPQRRRQAVASSGSSGKQRQQWQHRAAAAAAPQRPVVARRVARGTKAPASRQPGQGWREVSARAEARRAPFLQTATTTTRTRALACVLHTPPLPRRSLCLADFFWMRLRYPSRANPPRVSSRRRLPMRGRRGHYAAPAFALSYLYFGSSP